MLYYYDTPISKGHKRRSLKRLQRKRNKRFLKNEIKSLIYFYIYGILFTVIFCWALLNSPTMMK